MDTSEQHDTMQRLFDLVEEEEASNELVQELIATVEKNYPNASRQIAQYIIQQNNLNEDADPTVADRLYAYARGRATIFSDQYETPYARVKHNGHFEVLPIATGLFRGWLTRQFHVTTGRLVSATPVKTAIERLANEIEWGDNPAMHPVFKRIGYKDGVVYVNLGDKSRDVVRIDKNGHDIVGQDKAPYFTRTKGMLPLPRPISGGKLTDLLPFLGLNENQIHERSAIFSWLVMCFHPTGPYPLLHLVGPGGSLKTTRMRFLDQLVDPHLLWCTKEPREPEDLLVIARKKCVVAIDNLTFLSDAISDTLAGLSTTGSHEQRARHTDTGLNSFFGKRPVVLTSVAEVIINEDLSDRTYAASTKRIAKKDRKTEEQLYKEFEEKRPQILGALYDAVSMALNNAPTISGDEELPRLADYGRWALASCSSYDVTTEQMHTMWDTTGEYAAAVASEDLMCTGIVRWLQQNWKRVERSYPDVTPTPDPLHMKELYDGVIGLFTDDEKRSKKFPQSESALSRAMNKYAAALSYSGFSFTKTGKTIRFEPADGFHIQPFPNGLFGSIRDEKQDVDDDPDGWKVVK